MGSCVSGIRQLGYEVEFIHVTGLGTEECTRGPVLSPVFFSPDVEVRCVGDGDVFIHVSPMSG